MRSKAVCRAGLLRGRRRPPSPAGISLRRMFAPLEPARAGQGAGQCEEGTSDPWRKVGEGGQTDPIERSPPTDGERPGKARSRRGCRGREPAGKGRIRQGRKGTDGGRRRQSRQLKMQGGPADLEGKGQAGSGSQPGLLSPGEAHGHRRWGRGRWSPPEALEVASAPSTALGDTGFCPKGPASPPWAAAANADQLSAA